MIESCEKYYELLFKSGDVVCTAKINDKENKQIRNKYNTYDNEPLNTDDVPGFGSFVCPNPLNQKPRKFDNLKEIRTIFIDFDRHELPLTLINPEIIEDAVKSNDIPEIEKLPKPHIIASRGTEHHHIYYRIEPVEANEENLKLYKDIIKFFATHYGADRLVCNPHGLIRIPYTKRYKDENTEGYEIVSLDENLSFYNLVELHERLCGKVKPEKNKTKSDPEPKGGESFNVREFILTRNSRYMIKSGEGRSHKLLMLGLECRDWGLSESEALEIALLLNDKIFDVPESQSVVRHQINSAYRYAKNEFGLRLKEFAEQSTDKERNKYLSMIREEERVREALARTVYIASLIRLYDDRDRLDYIGNDAINSYLRSVVHTGLSFNHILKKSLVNIKKRVDFCPDRSGEFLDERGVSVYNRFRQLPGYSESEIDPEGVEVFLQHIEYLTGSEYEYKTLLAYLAHNIQRPGVKIPYAPLLINRNHGTGRSWLASLLAKHYSNYLTSVDHDNLKSGYTQYLVDKLFIVIHEIRDNDRFTFYERFKSRITEPHILIEEKYSRSFQVSNTVNFMFFSNHIDALRIDNKDRRLFVILNEKPRMDSEYYRTLYDILDSESKLNAIFQYLSNYDLSDYNPYEHPEMTEGKRILISASASELSLYLDELRMNPDEHRGSGFEYDFIGVRRLQQYIEVNGSNQIRGKVSEKQLKLYLDDAGYRERDIKKRFGGQVIHKKLWLKKEVDEFSELMWSQFVEYFGLTLEENQTTAY